MYRERVKILLLNPSEKDKIFFEGLLATIPSTGLQLDLSFAALSEADSFNGTLKAARLIFIPLTKPEYSLEKTLTQIKHVMLDVPIIPILEVENADTLVVLQKLGLSNYLVKSDLSGRWLVYFVQTVLEKQKAQAQTLTQMNHYRQILNATDEGILGVDLNDNHTFVNQRAAEILGYRVEEMLGRPSHQLWHHTRTRADGSSYPLRQHPIVRVYKNGESTRGTYIFWRKDGSKFPVKFTASPIFTDNKLTGAVILFRDITQTRDTEQALAQAAQEFSTFVRDIPIGVFRTAFGGTKLAANPALLKMLGYNTFEEYAQIDEAEHNRTFGFPQAEFEAKLRNEGDLKGFGAVWHKKDGTPIYVRENVHIVKDTTGEYLYFEGTLEDVSKEKAGEESLRLYEFIVNSSAQMMTLIAQNHTFAAVSDAYCRAHAKKRSDLIGKTLSEVWGAKIYEQTIQAKVDACFVGETLKFREWVNFPKTGLGRRFIEVTYSPYIAPNGDITNIVMVSTDITEAEEARSALMENEIRYRNLFEFAPDGVLIIDADGIITQCSQTAQKLYGYKKKKIIGTHIAQFLSPSSQNTFKTLFPKLKQLKMVDGEIQIVSKDGDLIDVWRKAYPMMGADDAFAGALIYDRDMTEFNAAHKSLRQLQTAIEASDDSIVITDTAGTIVYVNAAFERITGYTVSEALGENSRILKSGEQSEAFYKNLWDTITAGKVWMGQIINVRKDGTRFTERVSISPVYDEAHRLTNFVAVKHDITAELELEMQYQQAQKLEAIGQLAAGIAHEINTPMQFIDDNIGFLSESFAKLNRVWVQKHQLIEAAKTGEITETDLNALDELQQAVRVDFLRKEIPIAIEEAQDGIQRISKIVKAMRAFSHPGMGDNKVPMDVNAAIENTISIAKNEWKYVAEVEMQLDPNLPLVMGFPSEFNQAILNIVVNAAHTITDVVGDKPNKKGTITIHTYQKGGQIKISIKDTGMGISDENRSKIFDPFFTTKEVGRGTGQGLSITHHIIVEKHQGNLSFETKPGEGSIFIIALPISLNESEDE